MDTFPRLEFTLTHHTNGQKLKQSVPSTMANRECISVSAGAGDEEKKSRLFLNCFLPSSIYYHSSKIFKVSNASRQRAFPLHCYHFISNLLYDIIVLYDIVLTFVGIFLLEKQSQLSGLSFRDLKREPGTCANSMAACALQKRGNEGDRTDVSS